MAMAAGSSGGAGVDCDGEEQEDSSSAHLSTVDIDKAMDALTIDDDMVKPEDELAAFRQQWQRELEATPTPTQSPMRQLPPRMDLAEPVTDEERAKQLFLLGVEMERSGKLYEAIQHYKRAIQIVPDVETRLYESMDMRADSPEEELEEEQPAPRAANEDDDDEDAVEGEELLARLQRLLARKGVLIEPELSAKGAHISWMPYEVMLVIVRWVVGAELDTGSLERLAATCRGLFVLAREPDVWRAICVKTWGFECGVARALGYASWRDMYVRRPRLLLHGCYISKTTYLRHGENSFQDHSYRPWYLVEYYRYLRFFPEGQVVMWTTAEEPALCVSQLRYRLVRPGLMAGHYRLLGDKVVIVLKKQTADKGKAMQLNSTRFRARRRDTEQQPDQVFQIELELHNFRSRRNWQLTWSGYSVSTRRDHWTQFELSAAKFPPFAFSRVRSYTADAHAPLATQA